MNPILCEHRFAAPLQVRVPQNAIHGLLEPDADTANGSVRNWLFEQRKHTTLHCMGITEVLWVKMRM